MTADMTPAPLREPGTGLGLIDVFRRRYLLSLIVRKEVQIRYRGSVLGWLWSYVKPLVQFFVFYIALGVFLQLNKSIEFYAIYLLSGLTAVIFFNEALMNATRSLVDNAALIKKIYVPREMFPVSSVLVASVNIIPQMIVLAVIAGVLGWRPGLMNLLAIVLGFVIVALIATGLGMFFGSVNVSFRDSHAFVEIILMCAMWASPVMYQWQMVADVAPDWAMTVYQLNPLTTAVELFHYGFWEPLAPNAQMPPGLIQHTFVALAIAGAFLVVGQWVFRRLEGRFAQDL